MAVDFFTKCDQYALQPAVRAYTGLESKWNSLERSFSIWSDKLPGAWSGVAKKIFHSLPIAAAIFITPFWMNAFMGAGFYVAHLGYGPFTDATFNTAYTGAYVGLAGKAVVNVAEFLGSWNPKYAIYATVNGVASYLLFQNTNLQKI
ncbi:MAG: hypothetical protein JSR37_07240 [Verrucomicrobia bacterium]|nr:hypothetical protein [Verrucomicrobiota bacterium]